MCFSFSPWVDVQIDDVISNHRSPQRRWCCLCRQQWQFLPDCFHKLFRFSPLLFLYSTVIFFPPFSSIAFSCSSFFIFCGGTDESICFLICWIFENRLSHRRLCFVHFFLQFLSYSLLFDSSQPRTVELSIFTAVPTRSPLLPSKTVLPPSVSRLSSLHHLPRFFFSFPFLLFFS